MCLWYVAVTMVHVFENQYLTVPATCHALFSGLLTHIVCFSDSGINELTVFPCFISDSDPINFVVWRPAVILHLMPFQLKRSQATSILTVMIPNYFGWICVQLQPVKFCIWQKWANTCIQTYVPWTLCHPILPIFVIDDKLKICTSWYWSMDNFRNDRSYNFLIGGKLLSIFYPVWCTKGITTMNWEMKMYTVPLLSVRIAASPKSIQWWKIFY